MQLPNTSHQRTTSAALTRVAELSQVILPGTYVWAITVAPAASAKSSPVVTRYTAICALVLLIAGACVHRKHHNAGYILGIWGFIVACVATWLFCRSSLQMGQFDPWRAAAGSIGWGLYALGWGTSWRIGHHPEDDPRATLFPILEPRSPPQFRVMLSVALGTIGATACSLAAWRTADKDRALMLHGAALACSVAIVNASASIGMAQGEKRAAFAPRQRIAYAFPWIMAVSALIIIAIAWTLGN